MPASFSLLSAHRKRDARRDISVLRNRNSYSGRTGLKGIRHQDAFYFSRMALALAMASGVLSGVSFSG